LAARGIKTSFAKYTDIRELQKRFQSSPLEKGAISRYELRPIPRGNVRISEKAKLLEEEAWLENALLDEELDLTPERRAEMGSSLAEIKEKLHHLPGAPPISKVTKDIPLESFHRYKGTSGRVPEFVRELTHNVDLTQPQIEKDAAYERRKAEQADERAAERALKRIDEQILSGNLEEPINENVVSKILRGRVVDVNPVQFEEEEIMGQLE
jgi:hypothetical protein